MVPHDIDRTYDELLLLCIGAGDRRAAERLTARWQPRLLRTARRMLRNEDQARDAVQEAWVGICKGWLGLSDPSRFPAWAFGILHRKCADRIRREHAARARDDARGPERESGAGPRGEVAVAIDQALAMLSPDHRLAAVLFFCEGLTLAELAAATGVPLGTAKSRVFHARRQLKAALSGEQS